MVSVCVMSTRFPNKENTNNIIITRLYPLAVAPHVILNTMR